MSKRYLVPFGLTVFLGSALGSTALADQYPNQFENDLVSVCRYAAENDRSRLNQSVQKFSSATKSVARTYKVLGEGLRCNDMKLTAFTQYYGAQDTLRVLERYIIPTTIEIRDIRTSRVVPETISVSFVAPSQ